MAGILYLFSALLLGSGLWRWLRLPVYAFEVPAVSCLLGLFAWIWLAFLFSLLLPYNLSLAVASSLSALIGGWLWLKKQSPQTIIPLPGGLAAWIIWAAASVIIMAGLGVLSSTHFLKPEASGLYSGAATWADFGLHSSLISHFTAGNNLTLDLPIAAGAKLTYPFLIDFLAALLHYGGWSLHIAILVPGLLLMASIVQLFIGFSLRLFNSLGAAVTGLGLFLLGGAIAGLDVAWSDWQASGLNLAKFLSQVPRDYTSISELNIHFNNVVADALLPQRPYLFGLAILLFILSLLWTDRQRHQLRWRLAAAIVIGLLPLAHAHTFIIAVAVLSAVAAENIWKNRRLSSWPLIFGIVAILSLPQIAWQQLANGFGSGGHFAPGWAVGPDQSVFSFWWQNFGFFGVYAIVLPVFLYLWRRQHLIWYLPFALLLAISQIYSFQPFAYDNLKLIMSAYLICCLFAGWHLVSAWRRQPLVAALLMPVVLFSLIPGALTITREFQLHDQFASIDDIAVADWARVATPASAIFLATDRPNQPVTALAGRSTVLGYRGWLYSYNLPYESRITAVSEALKGQADSAALAPFNASYLLVNRAESSDWTVDHSRLSAQHPVVYQNDSWIVYKLR